MENNQPNTEPDWEGEKDFFSKVEIPYSQSKEDVWKSMQGLIQEEDKSPKTPTKVVRLNWLKWSAAAALILLIGSGLFMKFYSISYQTTTGEYASHTLPDGSQVHLNAESSVSYAPYWWNFSREVELEGEAFFEVEKGEKFSVVSSKGTTSVLGTSFNIYARDKDYQVYCSTGKVKVENPQSHPIILEPGNFALLNANGKLEQVNKNSEDEILAWRLNKFIYNNTPLSKVIADLERHYDVEIELENPTAGQELYTAIFNRSEAVEDIVEIICLSFEFEFEKSQTNSFIIK
jgi:ferric-dicitrate binding protein FerR (iron transport regulator)